MKLFLKVLKLTSELALPSAAAANSLIPQTYLTLQPVAKGGNTSVICTEEEPPCFKNGWHL